MNRLAGKIAIVTGASSGIDHATARLFASEGADVIVSARRQAELDALVEAIARDGGTAVAVTGNVGDEHLAQRLVTTALEHFGGLDIAFNNVGIVGIVGIVGPMGPLQDMATSVWHDVVNTNLTAAFLGAKYQVPALRCWPTAGLPSAVPDCQKAVLLGAPSSTASRSAAIQTPRYSATQQARVRTCSPSSA